jgi:hypothetical protein
MKLARLRCQVQPRQALELLQSLFVCNAPLHVSGAGPPLLLASLSPYQSFPEAADTTEIHVRQTTFQVIACCDAAP